MRLLVAAAVVLAAVRGGLFVLAGDVGLSDPTLSVNALVPAIVAAVVVGIAVKLRPELMNLSRPLLIGWGLIVFVVAVNLLVQTVGLRLYGIGVAQYLVYPTLALAIWPLFEEGDERLLVRVIVAAGVLVALSVLLQAADIESFIQSANAEVDGLAANRYAGITGSYLHTSAFLGCAFVLLMGDALGRRGWLNWAFSVLLLTVAFSAVILTFSRSGVMISAIGLAALFLFAAKDRRALFLALVVPAVAIAIGVGAWGGVTPEAAGERAASGLDAQGDKGNELRADAISGAVDTYQGQDLLHQVMGDGLASTGNARQLEGGDSTAELNIVESYYLKLLTETGFFGLILIGGFLVWALLYFLRTLWCFRDPLSASLAAAGLGLGLYNIIYPALETQLLALAWWLMFSISLRRTWLQSDREASFLLLPIGGGRKTGPPEEEFPAKPLSGVEPLPDPVADGSAG